MWTYQRKLWKSIAKLICLSHSVPPLEDEVEFFLFTLILYVVVYKDTTNGVIAGMTSALLLHLLRGIRWQLIPVYPVILAIIFLDAVSIVARVLFAFAMVLSLFLCYQIPASPPIVADEDSDRLEVGIQDIVLSNPQSNARFIVRAYYPIDQEVLTVSKKRPFINDISLLLMCLTGIFGITISDPTAILESSIIWTIFALLFITQKCIEYYENTQFSNYYPEGSSVLAAMAKFGSMPYIIMSHMCLTKLHVMEDAPISNKAKQIVLFYSGLAGVRGTHASICMKAASEGYFVMCMESSDRTPILSIIPPLVGNPNTTSTEARGGSGAGEGQAGTKGDTTSTEARGGSGAADSSAGTKGEITGTVGEGTPKSGSSSGTGGGGKGAYEKRGYEYVSMRNEEIGHKMSEEEAEAWRYEQLCTRTRESIVMMDFLKHVTATAGVQSTTPTSTDTTTATTTQYLDSNGNAIYLGYQSAHPWTLAALLLPFKSSQLHWSTDVSKSLFWQSLTRHTFANLTPYLLGHSFGGSTVLNILNDSGADAVRFRSLYPISAVVAQDPWTPVLSNSVKYIAKDSVAIPCMIMYAQFFESFKEYDIITGKRYAYIILEHITYYILAIY